MNHPPTSKIDILLIEDNPHDEELILYTLKKYHITEQVVVVRDGEQALEIINNPLLNGNNLQKLLPKLILLDIKLPKVDGVGILEQIKNNPLTAGIPVVVFTSSNEEIDIMTSYRLRANAYVVKPVDAEKFADAILRVGVYWLQHNKPLLIIDDR